MSLSPQDRKFPGISGKEAVVLLLSLLLSFGIWLLHNLSLNYTSVLRVPVVARSKIEGHSPLSSGATLVQARCRTTGFETIRLSRSSGRRATTVDFDPADLRPLGEDSFYITASELGAYAGAIFGDGARIESYLGDTLVFRFPRENYRKVPVVPSVGISYKSQYMASSPLTLSPDSVVIYGEPYLIDNIERVRTRPFELENLKSAVHGEVSLEGLKGVRMSEEKVAYSMDVSRFVEIRAEIPVTGRNVPSDKVLIIFPATAEVSFRCSYPVTVRPEEEVRLFVDYRDFSRSSSGRCLPRIEGLPLGVLSWSMQPEVFDCVESSR